MIDKFDLQNRLENQLQEALNQEEKLLTTENYIEIVDKTTDRLSETLGKDLEWLNTEMPLSLEDFRGRVVVLDFFTYCCINCLHILPVLAELEKQYAVNQEVAVIGVHSAKFDNERSSKNVANAILKNEIHHPVINDFKMSLWERLQIYCWPTLIILGPDGQHLFSLVGEGNRVKLFLFVEAAVKFYRNKLNLNTRIPIKLLKNNLITDSLCFPGKIALFPDKLRLVLSDSGHHRIIIISLDGVIQTIIGGSNFGFKDGSFSETQFCNPQGVAVSKNCDIYVADTGNHAIRKVDLFNFQVNTVAGLGIQGTDKEGGKPGNQQPISSPWDVCFGPTLGGDVTLEESVLYIAMSGLHQIWALCLVDLVWKGQKKLKGACFSIAGNGNEENRNNCYPEKAGFAQPSGLTYANIITAIDKSVPTLFVADSESSSIRSISLVDGAVKAVVGAARNPTDLFAHGDIDGLGVEVKLQHPLGVAWNSERQELFVADTYNHKIKFINPITKICKTYPLVFDLQEPGGICICEQRLYVTDTNNHALKVLDLITESINELFICALPKISNEIVQEDATDSTHSLQESDLSISISPVEVCPGGKISLTFNVVACRGTSFTQGAPQTWSLQLLENTPLISSKAGSFSSNSVSEKSCQIDLIVNEDAQINRLWQAVVKAKVVLCQNEAGICASRIAIWTIEVAVKENTPLESKLSLCWKVSF